MRDWYNEMKLTESLSYLLPVKPHRRYLASNFYVYTIVLLLVISLLPEAATGQSRISILDINYELANQQSLPSLQTVLANSRWQSVETRSLLKDNTPFLIRIPEETLLKGDTVRILSIASEATLSIYQPGGKLTKVRDLLSTSTEVNDRLSIKLGEDQAMNGYFFAYVEPSIAWVPSAQPSSSRGLRLVTTHVDNYDIVGSHFDVNWLWAAEASMLFLLGGIFLMGCYFGILYVSNRDEYIFGIYAAYLFFHSIYWAERITSFSLPFFTRSVDQIVVNTLSQICFHVAFTLLAHELLNFRKYYPTLRRLWRLFASAQLLFGLFFTFSIYAGVDPVLLLNAFAIERCFIGIVALFTTFYFVLKPHNIYCYFLGFASFAFVGSALSAMLLGNLKIFAFGLSIEILTFAYAIGHKIRKADDSRIESEKSAFMLEREVIRTKDAALRAQMNPHFVSNVINALRALILDGENKQAYSYLSRFAHVVRTMLGSADKQLISLSEELRLLKDYVALEELRFRRSVTFLIETSSDIDIEGSLIPPMLLQPLVENAMHHGLFPLTEREPQITLSINTQPLTNTLKISVSDNGIGRSKARHNQQKRLRNRPSMAMNIIRERIKLLQQDIGAEASSSMDEALQIQDLTNSDGSSGGTKVTLVIPKTSSKNQQQTVSNFKRYKNPFSFNLKAEQQESF